MSEFLKKLQTALDKGEQDEDVKQFMENIEKKADSIEDAEKAVEKRLKDAGERELTEEEKSFQKELETLSPEESLKKIEEHNQKIVDIVAEEDAKWKKLALIENMKTELKNLEGDFEELKEKYEKNIADIADSIHSMEKEFGEKYGEELLNPFNEEVEVIEDTKEDEIDDVEEDKSPDEEK